MLSEGVAQVQQGLEAYAGELQKTKILAWLARGYGGAGQIENGLATVTEALQQVDKTDERFYEAEVYRIKGAMLLNDERMANGKEARPKQNDERKTKEEEQKNCPHSSFIVHHSSFIIHRSEEAKACFLKAIEIAQQQQKPSPSNCAQ